jgi:hypothetical protein
LSRYTPDPALVQARSLDTFCAWGNIRPITEFFGGILYKISKEVDKVTIYARYSEYLHKSFRITFLAEPPDLQRSGLSLLSKLTF